MGSRSSADNLPWLPMLAAIYKIMACDSSFLRALNYVFVAVGTKSKQLMTGSSSQLTIWTLRMTQMTE